MRPQKGTYPDYYEHYIPLVRQETVVQALEANKAETLEFFRSVNTQQENYSYADGKWTVKQVLNHLCDTERVFAYRALRFARKDAQQPLSFDQDNYVANADCSKRPLQEMCDEFESIRNASISLYKSFNDETLLRAGATAAGTASVLAIGYTICGHSLHHISVVKERYLKQQLSTH